MLAALLPLLARVRSAVERWVKKVWCRGGSQPAARVLCRPTAPRSVPLHMCVHARLRVNIIAKLVWGQGRGCSAQLATQASVGDPPPGLRQAWTRPLGTCLLSLSATAAPESFQAGYTMYELCASSNGREQDSPGAEVDVMEPRPGP